MALMGSGGALLCEFGFTRADWGCLGLSDFKYSLRMFGLFCMLPPSGRAESAAAGE